MSDPTPIRDLLVVGGGINGAGIARDAAGRGLSVALCEMGDIAGATSSASSKLIHGGLRYLEHYDFGLVRESLQERETLLAIAPHLTHPIRFVMPHSQASRSLGRPKIDLAPLGGESGSWTDSGAQHFRPAWMIRLGLWLYDHIGGSRTLPASETLALADSAYGAPLQDIYRQGHIYSDVQVDDARLTLANAKDAEAHGASILPRTELLEAVRENGLWRCRLKRRDGTSFEIIARAIANVAGPWAAKLHAKLGGEQQIGIQLVRGSHIVVPRLYAGDHAYTLQNNDGRIVFLLPFQQDFTLIGTTEVRMADPDDLPLPSDPEVDYLCRATNRYLKRPIGPSDVVWKFAGVRPLLDDGKVNASKVSREYRLFLDKPASGNAPLLTIVGGKLTTYRRLAEKALKKLAPVFPAMGPEWTASVPLPQQVRPKGEPGREFGGGLCERDARYYLESEWAHEANDTLWRRTKAGLRMTEEQRTAFAVWLERNR